MANTADVIIIGGGIIGNAIAYYLAKKGTDVIVLEGGDHIGNGGSSRNGGGVRQSGRTQTPRHKKTRPKTPSLR